MTRQWRPTSLIGGWSCTRPWRTPSHPSPDPSAIPIRWGSRRDRPGPRSWENLDAQLHDGPDRRRLSLDGMWRADGSPAGKGPLEWIALARPLVPAFNRYFENLAACGYREKSRYRLSSSSQDEHLDDDRQAGDVITSLWLIAEAYAAFLDSVVSSDE